MNKWRVDTNGTILVKHGVTWYAANMTLAMVQSFNKAVLNHEVHYD